MFGSCTKTNAAPRRVSGACEFRSMFPDITEWCPSFTPRLSAKISTDCKFCNISAEKPLMTFSKLNLVWSKYNLVYFISVDFPPSGAPTMSTFVSLRAVWF